MMHTPFMQGMGTRLLLTVLVVISAALLSGCSDGDWDMFFHLAEDWASSNDVWDGENLNMGNLARLGVEGQIDAFLNGPPAPLEAASVVDDIREAESLANAGAQEGGYDGLRKIDEAIRMRPQDWSLWEQKGAVALASGRAEEAELAFDSSARLARTHLASGGDCKLYQRNLLTQREKALLTQINRIYEGGQQPPDELINRLDSVRGELGMLDTPIGLCG
jgi:hypothetical protein